VSVYLRCALLAVIGAVVLLLSATSATAAPPGCDWGTDAGTQACLGGGPFDAGKDGHGDTYGPTGVPAYLHDAKVAFPRANDHDLLTMGYAIFKAAATGASADVIVSALVKNGVAEGGAGYLASAAVMWLCPSYL
jgi:hypothetical protein